MRLHPVCLTALLLTSAGLGLGSTYQPCAVDLPAPPREFRAAWIATVGNIDWPSRSNLSSADQRAELIALLDGAARLKLNVVIFQVRPGCDALYPSRIEPWSEYLTGTMGKAPEPYYDPLAFAIEEAHKRGLELHAWFNPYRARYQSAKSPIAPTHISRTHPELVRQYGPLLWLDPGEERVQDYSLTVVMDVVNRYDVDGIHFDDYFYPYKQTNALGKEIDFPDDATWRKQGAHPKTSREDWRRENVNQFVQRAYKSIKSAKPWVKFGLSPFGIWRPRNPPPIDGLDAYDKLYADSRKWLSKGWLDYFAPQLYWPIDPPEHSFPTLLKWWAEQNPKERLLTPGLDVTRAHHDPREIVNQILLARKQPGTAGQVHWDLKSLLRNTNLVNDLTREVYTQPALVPNTPWLSRGRPGKPILTVTKDERTTLTQFNWSVTAKEKVARWILLCRINGQWKTEILPAGIPGRIWATQPEVVAVCEVDRYGNLSPMAGVARQD